MCDFYVCLRYLWVISRWLGTAGSWTWVWSSGKRLDLHIWGSSAYLMGHLSAERQGHLTDLLFWGSLDTTLSSHQALFLWATETALPMFSPISSEHLWNEIFPVLSFLHVLRINHIWHLLYILTSSIHKVLYIVSNQWMFIFIVYIHLALCIQN